MSLLAYYWWSGQQQFIIGMQLNFSSMATLGTEKIGHCKEMDVAKTGRTRLHRLKTLPELSLRDRNPNTCYSCSKN